MKAVAFASLVVVTFLSQIISVGSMSLSTKCLKLAEVFVKKSNLSPKGSRICIYVAGGGTGAISALGATPGASAVLLEGLLAYDRRSFLENVAYGLVDEEEKKKVSSLSHFCSKEAALALSNAALRRSISLSPNLNDRSSCIGVGCTSSLVSSQPKKGLHRCFVAVSSSRGSQDLYSLVLSKEENRSRSSEDEIVSFVVLRAILGELRKFGSLELNNLRDIDEIVDNAISSYLVGSESINIEEVHSEIKPIDDAADEVASGEADFTLLVPTPSLSPSSPPLLPVNPPLLPKCPIIFPGSFNPPHEGHLRLAHAAIEVVKERQNEIVTTSDHQNLIFELSITNPDKPPIPSKDVVERVAGFFNERCAGFLPNNWGVLLTSAPLFAQKIKLFSSTLSSEGDSTGVRVYFVIGSDTMVRIIDPKYYDDDISKMLKAIDEMKHLGVHFIVGGRLEQKVMPGTIPKFITGEEELFSSPLPKDLRGIFTLLGKDAFQVDLSSSDIRATFEG